jgi:hypothetical protein
MGHPSLANRSCPAFTAIQASSHGRLRSKDPTAPLVASESVRLELMTLIPLRWGSRRYLVRHDAVGEFCSSIAQSIEPRSVEAGWEFLRAGHHRKKGGKTRPTECNTILR